MDATTLISGTLLFKTKKTKYANVCSVKKRTKTREVPQHPII